MAITQDDLNAISSAVRNNLSYELSLIEQQFTLLKEIHILMGLDYTNPLTVTQNNRFAGNIIQDIVLDGINKTTLVKRRPPQVQSIGNAIIGSTFVVG
jgi:hypothetical protein